MKLFGIKRTDSHKIIYLFGIKIKLRKFFVKTLSKEKFEVYLNKYHYILDKEFKICAEDNKYSNCIWQLWLQGFDNAPDIVKKCVKSVKYFCHDKKIIYLDEKNISNYITIPEHIMHKYKKGIISPAHFSDYIRVALLSKYGGLWLDSTILLTDKIPDEIFESKIFLFKDLGWFDQYDSCKKMSRKNVDVP